MFDNKKVIVNTTEALVLASKHKKQLLAWYKKMSNLNIYIKDPKVIMDTNGVIIIEYIIDKDLLEDFFPDSLTDPDDDGNHPIKKYLVTKFKASHNRKLLLTKVIKENYVNTPSPKKIILKSKSKKNIKTLPKKSTVKKIIIKKKLTPSLKIDCNKSKYKANWDVIKNGVMLAHTYKDPKTGKIKNPPKGTTQAPNGWYLSEKFDGYRAIWDGKDFRSRAGNIFNAPEWFKLWMPPGIVLDGELFLGRECFEQCGLLRKKTPDAKEWIDSNIKYQVFDCPSHKGMFEERQKFIKELIDSRCKCKDKLGLPDMAKKVKCPLIMTSQIKVKTEEDVMKRFDKLVEKGAEGVMLRAPNSPYEPKRTAYLLKVKQLFDDECRIIGYKEGSGKYKDMLGAFKCELKKNPKIKFDISGMDDEIRKNYKKTHKVGTIVTFTYMGLTGTGVPRHPNYLRIRKGKL